MRFWFKKKIKPLTISDALRTKEVEISVQNKHLKIRAFKLAKALEYLEMMQFTKKITSETLSTKEEITEFHNELQAKIPHILSFCLGAQADLLDLKTITVTEVMDILLAAWSANDMDRVSANFQAAITLKPKQTPASA